MITLEKFKQHCYADDIGGVEDDLMQGYLDAATAFVVDSTRRTFEELCDMGGGHMPVMLEQAIMMVGAHFYNQREAVTAGQASAVPYAVSALIKPYVKLV